jgi:hypothetical protein
MKYSEFQRPISVDFVPRGCLCEWCGQPAERQLTAIGGIYHNRSGVFCHLCGEKFVVCVIRGSVAEMQKRDVNVCVA